MKSLTIGEKEFLLDGQAITVISGALHYFRIPKEYWRDRLEKLKHLGCNTVETYVPWNLHEPKPEQYNFSGMLDIAEFLQIAKSLGLWVIIRPSPYICAELEFGGLPWWLLCDAKMRVRSSYPGFLDAVDRYYQILVPLLASWQLEQGGCIIVCQIENEYGYYGSSKTYLEALRSMLLKYGITVPFVTSDNPDCVTLERGSLDGVLATGNFGSEAKARMQSMADYDAQKPLMCMEFWLGWFDSWGGTHHKRDAEDAAQCLDEILQQGSVNLYMFHGGTNFGFCSGANYDNGHKPHVTSYDYDAPLSEHGLMTDKYWAFREVLARHTSLSDLTFTTKIRQTNFGSVNMTGFVSLNDYLLSADNVQQHPSFYSFEDLGYGLGYVAYQFDVFGPHVYEQVQIIDATDRVHVFLDDVQIALRNSVNMEEAFSLNVHKEKQTITVLVENQGRVNFGPRLNQQRKGIRQCVSLDGFIPENITHIPIDFENLNQTLEGMADECKQTHNKAGFYTGSFFYESEDSFYDDCFVDMQGWGKGVVLVNGQNLGRFWEIGPQRSLYLPGAFLKKGKNTIIVFETEGKRQDSVNLCAEPYAFL